jgi:hypothetical protein
MFNANQNKSVDLSEMNNLSGDENNHTGLPEQDDEILR